MLDVKGKIGIDALVDPTVLATVIGATPDEPPRLRIHYGAAVAARDRAFSRMYATKSMYSTYLSYSPAFAGCE